MDEAVDSGLFKKIEDTVTDWSQRDTDAYRNLSDQVSKLRDELESLLSSASENREFVDQTAERVRNDLRAFQEDVAAQAERRRDTQEQAEHQEKELAERNQELGDARERIGQLERELAQAQEAGESAKRQAQELEDQLAKERQAAQEKKDHVAQLEKAVAERSDAGQAAQERIAKLERQLADAWDSVREANTRCRDLEQTENDLRSQLRDLNSQLEKSKAEEESASLDLEMTLADLSKARDDLDKLREADHKSEELQRLLDEERQRVGALEARLREETAKGTKASLAQQLAEALKDAEESQEEIVSLRAEIEKLRRAQASPTAEQAGREVERPQAGLEGFETGGGEGGEDATRDIGRALVKSKAITPEQLKKAREEQRKNPQRALGTILIEKEMVAEDVVARALAEEAQAPVLDLKEQTIDPDAVKLLSARLARLHTCLPIRTERNNFVLAMANPLDLVAIEDIERTTNMTVKPAVSTASEIKEAIKEHYGNE